MRGLLEDVVNDVISIAYKENKKNRKKIQFMISQFTQTALKEIQPYLYGIFLILILLFATNCFQFYYFLRSIRINDLNASD